MTPSAESKSPTPAQRRAIEAPPGPMLVLAGPGAGKTFCLIERIRWLLENQRLDAARILAFTFTNKAADEIARRVEPLGAGAHAVTKGTIHAFCVRILRELGGHIQLERGFGIANEDYQVSVLRRVRPGLPRYRYTGMLKRFSAYRLGDRHIDPEDYSALRAYERMLADRGVLDFDTIIVRTAELLEIDDVARDVQGRWDVVLVDEFQDLNLVQYRVVRVLAERHRNLFAVGDDEQSIYSFNGAHVKRVVESFRKDFAGAEVICLDVNHRCPAEVVEPARRLLSANEPLFAEARATRTQKTTTNLPRAFAFETDDAEAEWIVADVLEDRRLNSHKWSDVAVLYKTHEIGQRLETAFLGAGIPCRLAHGRALSDDPPVAYVVAAARVIAAPGDDVARDEFFRSLLPHSICAEAAADTRNASEGFVAQLTAMLARLPADDDRAKLIRRVRANCANLGAVRREHTDLLTLVDDLLSRNVKFAPSVLTEYDREITDPAANPEVVALADRLRAARRARTPVFVELTGGVEIPVRGMLERLGVSTVTGPQAGAYDTIRESDCASVGLPLAVFKAGQVLEMSDLSPAFRDFTAIDIETTDLDPDSCDIVDIAAVRVRDGRIVDRWSSLVRPDRPITAEATRMSHGLTDAHVAGAPRIDAVWPAFRDFCGSDTLVAHNGTEFDFRVLARIARERCGATFAWQTYDSLPLARELFPTSASLPILAPLLGVAHPNAHRALPDTLVLAELFPILERRKVERARKTSLTRLLDHLGVALALSAHESLCDEARIFREVSQVFALSKFSDCLDYYEAAAGKPALPNRKELIARLGGERLMNRIQEERGADQRYPVAMQRLRRLIAALPQSSDLGEQIARFLERVALSKFDGDEPDSGRVNLITLHSAKGLEFPRVYIAGAEDGQLPGRTDTTRVSKQDMEEARRVLYVGMTRTMDRLILTCVATRAGKPTGGHRFLDEMELVLEQP